MKKRMTTLFCLALVLLISMSGMTSIASPSPTGGGPAEASLGMSDSGQRVVLRGDEVLTVSLESNPSTGYGWQVAGVNRGILRKVEDGWVPGSPGLLGAPGTQTLRFAGVAKGQTMLNLVYGRPWEPVANAEGTFSVEVAVAEPSSVIPASAPAADEGQAAQVESASATSLPSAFNWCDSGGCTSVKNQGPCGSCWAFGTVGPLELNIKIKDGVEENLSEQYLVSCNTNGWDCGGGWWAHDYHQSRIPPTETEAGAVYEADFPYTATNGSCDGPYAHQEKIEDWAYVGSSAGVPPVADIKQAIYDHGPIGAAVCVNSEFQTYNDGIFTGPSCGDINHAITLVGWDDTAPGYWILRNSWGTYWGEGGYMRIAYGTSYVGYSANYVVYKESAVTPPAAPMGLAASAVSPDQIDLSWIDNSDDESGFKVERSDAGAGFVEIGATGANATSYSDAGVVGDTTYAYRVRAYNGAGDSTYSNEAGATTPSPPPSIDQTATGDIPVAGTVSGSYLDTRASDAAVQSITERESGGKPSLRHSYLEHKWTFDVQAGSSVALHVNAWAPASSDGDSFDFSYSTDDQSYERLFGIPVEEDYDTYQTKPLQLPASGTVYVRVVDTDRSRDSRALDTVFIDHMFIRTILEPGDPPSAPESLAADGVSASQINLAWTDTADNEDGFQIERSVGGGPFDNVGSVGANVSSYPDGGLSPSTTYSYQVRAYNGSESDPSNVAIASTQEGGTIHLGDLASASVAPKKNSWDATVTVEVHDGSGGLAPGALVEGTWSEGATGTGSCTTGVSGLCQIPKTKIKSTVASVTFTVDDVSLDGYTYVPGENHNGTSIMVLKP